MSQLTQAKTTLKTALGSFRIQRLPLRKSETLQGWDAADELLIDTLASNHQEALEQRKNNTLRMLLINDQFGALATTFNAYKPDSWSDSAISHSASQFNLNQNTGTDQKEKTVLTCIASTEKLSGIYSVVIIKIPKTLSLLEQQLISLSHHVDSDTLIIAGGMTKNIHNSTLALFEKNIGETTTSRATKKARLIFCKVDPNNHTADVSLLPTRYFAEPLNAELTSYANGFSRDRLDLGARAMLQAIDENTLPDAEKVADLACGNGVLGLYAMAQLTNESQQRNRRRSIDFIDESYMAIAASKENYKNIISDADKKDISPSFYAQDCIKKTNENGNKTCYDWIICNPPFHIGTAMDTYIANRMFQQSHAALQAKGQLWVVANRHLKYQHQIKKIFNNYKIVLTNKKFVVITATKV